MAKTVYIRDEQTGNPVVRRLLIILLAVALTVAVIVGLYIVTGDQRTDAVLKDFKLAMTENRYDDAIAIYRLTQGNALTSGLLDQQQKNFQHALAEMEAVTNAQLASIENHLLDQMTLNNNELTFAEKMAEVSAVRLIAFLRGLCQDYLQGKTSLPILENAFSQLATLPNLQDAIGELPSEFERMTGGQAMMMTAMADFEADHYWAAWAGFATILDHAELAGYVHDQARLRMDECRTEMYRPLLDEAQALMAGGRFLSAQKALQKMAAVYTEDTVIQADLTACATHLPAVLLPYNGRIELISIKPLINNNAAAFDGDSYADAANDSMMTTGEFSAMLAELYANNYILIDSSRIYTSDRRVAQLELPEGKKPLVLVIEGLNYYASRRQTGNAWDLVLDEGGEVSAEYQNSSGQMTVDRQGEAIGILDLFVSAHPDFSHDGAKGTISLTGYECIFGQVTEEDQLDDRNAALQDNGFAPISLSSAQIAENKAAVQTIINRLKNTGWLFASSTYGFIDARNQSLERIQADTGKWLAQVGALTGPVAFLNYPNGSFLTGADERSIWLQNQGFILFGGLGTTAYMYPGSNYIYVDKTPVNGYTMRNSATYKLDRLFKVSRVYDQAGRP